MIYKGTFTVVLDACVLYPASVRDILLRLASENLYRPKWTEEINNEWKRNLLNKREDLNRESLDSTVERMNGAFRDAQITGYRDLIEVINLPDPNDRHVVAAAIRCNADKQSAQTREEVRDTLRQAGLEESANLLYTNCENN